MKTDDLPYEVPTEDENVIDLAAIRAKVVPKGMTKEEAANLLLILEALMDGEDLC